MMHHEAGVRTVVAGGRPQVGPMQALAGSRGAQYYEAADIDSDISLAEAINASVTADLPDRNIEFRIDVADFNLRDQIRRGENFPLQFAYEAADCRIFFTLQTSTIMQHCGNTLRMPFGRIRSYAFRVPPTNLRRVILPTPSVHRRRKRHRGQVRDPMPIPPQLRRSARPRYPASTECTAWIMTRRGARLALIAHSMIGAFVATMSACCPLAATPELEHSTKLSRNARFRVGFAQ